MRKTWKILALCFAAVSIVTMQAGKDTSVTAAQVNGTWKTKGGEFKIWALASSASRSNFRAFTNTKRRRAQAPIRAKAAASRRFKAIPLSSNQRARRGMPNHAKIHWRKTCSDPNQYLRIRPQRERRRHIQKSFRQETKVRVGLTSAFGVPASCFP